MSPAAFLLETLSSMGVRLWVAGGKLRYRTGGGSLPEGLREQMRAHRSELLAIVEGAPAASAGIECDTETPPQATSKALVAEELTSEGGVSASREVCRDTWDTALSRMTSAWDDYAARCQATGQKPAWFEDDDLTAKVGTAIRAGDFPGTRAAIADWREAWSAIMGPEFRFDTSPAGEPCPALLLADARRLSALGLNAWLVDADLESRAAARRELHARADQVLDEAHGLRPSPNPSVHAMFDEARTHFGYGDQEARSITVWLRRSAPGVAARWPEAPIEAPWIDWRRYLGPEDVPVLDRAFEGTRRRPEEPRAHLRKPKAQKRTSRRRNTGSVIDSPTTIKQDSSPAPDASSAGPRSPGTRRGEEP